MEIVLAKCAEQIFDTGEHEKPAISSVFLLFFKSSFYFLQIISYIREVINKYKSILKY